MPTPSLPLEPPVVRPVARSASMRRKFLREVRAFGLPTDAGPPRVIAESDLAPLPAPAQRFLRFMRAVGRPRDAAFCARWDGRFRMGPDKPWVPCEVWQFNTRLAVARIFHMKLRVAGIVPMYVRDVYASGHGRMLGRIIDAVAVVDESDARITVGELVTYLNDAVLFAPSLLLGPEAAWTPVDDGAFDVALTDHGTTVSARVFVDADGAVTDFSTTDRFGTDPASPAAGLVRTRWTTPVDGWTLANERPRPRRARAVWHYPSGDFAYAEYTSDTMDLAFNAPPGVPPATR